VCSGDGEANRVLPPRGVSPKEEGERDGVAVGVRSCSVWDGERDGSWCGEAGEAVGMAVGAV